MSEGSTDNATGIQAQLGNMVMEAVEFAIADILELYRRDPTAVPTKDQVDGLIAQYCRRNAAISAKLNLFPGPLGMAAALPELSLLFRNLARMICEIGAAHGHLNVLNAALVAEVLAMSLGAGGIGVITMQGTTQLMKRPALQLMQRLLQKLGVQVTQKLIKAQVAKWLPGVGAAAMAAWSWRWTKQVGTRAKERFSKEIIQDRAVEPETCVIVEVPAVDVHLQGRLRALANVMLIDGPVADAEVALLRKVAGRSGLDAAHVEEFIAGLTDFKPVTVDYALFQNNPEQAVWLLVELVAMAKADGQVHPAEKLYLGQVARALGLAEESLNSLLEEGSPWGWRTWRPLRGLVRAVRRLAASLGARRARTRPVALGGVGVELR